MMSGCLDQKKGKPVMAGPLTRFGVALLVAVIGLGGCSHHEEEEPERNLFAKLQPVGGGRYDVVVTVLGDNSEMIDEAAVKGIAAKPDSAIRLDPRHCRNYKAAVENSAYRVKTICTGISAIGVLSLVGDQVVLTIDNLSYTELRDMVPVNAGNERTLEDPKLLVRRSGGSMSVPMGTGGEQPFALRQ